MRPPSAGARRNFHWQLELRRDFSHQRCKPTQRNLKLPIAWLYFPFELLPYDVTGTVVHFGKATFPIKAEDQQMLRPAPQGDTLCLRNFNFYLTTVLYGIYARRRGGHKFHPIVISSQALTETPYKMAIWSEMPSRKHFFQLSDDPI